MKESQAGGESEGPKVGLKDFLAMAIAALETFLFPLVAIAVVLAILVIVLSFTR